MADSIVVQSSLASSAMASWGTVTIKTKRRRSGAGLKWTTLLSAATAENTCASNFGPASNAKIVTTSFGTDSTRGAPPRRTRGFSSAATARTNVKTTPRIGRRRGETKKLPCARRLSCDFTTGLLPNFFLLHPVEERGGCVPSRPFSCRSGRRRRGGSRRCPRSCSRRGPAGPASTSAGRAATSSPRSGRTSLPGSGPRSSRPTKRWSATTAGA
mmetsp:Transcript_426/g.1553  ORF Transcript_426/g.1553 Transcript_426/m.1553 type:complete len:214 (+) Transcript_426:1116-1757(+)